MFDFEAWWLIAFPVFFGLGWLAARIDIKHLVSESRALPRSYFKGLNFLLNEQPDRAIEAFVEVVNVDPETVELHFALGSLFRRRGETDRAIRMHRTLLERQGLSDEQRLAALYELGEDYLKAGLLDRAEEAFAKLTDTAVRSRALRNLLQIYELEKDWAKAIDAARLLAEDSGQSWAKEIANYHCELAVVDIGRGRVEDAHARLDQAFMANRKCVRASVILGDLAAKRGDHAAAIEAWRNIEGQNPAYLAIVAQRLLSSYRGLDRAIEGLAMLKDYVARFPSLDLLDAAFQATLEAEGPAAAYQLVREELKRNPTLVGLDKLLEARLLTAEPRERPELELVRSLVHGQTGRLARYRCENCGFRARQFYWHCPACGTWESYPPRRTEEFELAP